MRTRKWVVSQLGWTTVGVSILLGAGGAYAFDPESALAVPKQTTEAVAAAKAAIAADGALAIEFATSTVFDTQAPTPGTLSAPGYLKAGPVSITVANASDANGSGLKQARLWAKQGDTANWVDTTLKYDFQPGETGTTFSYANLLGEGAYYFAVVVEDNAGNISPLPEGEGAARTILDNVRPVITLVGPSALAWDMGTPYADPGATASDAAEGDITSRIQVSSAVNVGAIGTYTVVYNVSDQAGNAATPVSRTVDVIEPSGAFALTIQQPTAGSIAATPAPNAPSGRYLPGTEVTLALAGAQNYDVTAWNGATMQPGTPNIARTIMDANKTVSVVLAAATGSIAVDVTPNTAAWTITGGDGQTIPGTGDKTVSVPTGAVSIAFSPLAGMKTPVPKSGTLAKGQTLSFAGLYEAAPYALSIPANLSGAPGATVAVPVVIAGANGLQSYSFSLAFDGNLLEATSAQAGSVATSWGAPAFAPAAGSVQVSASGAPLGGGAGQLVTISFKVKDTVTESTAADLAFSAVALTANGAAVADPSAEGAAIAIEIGEYTWGDADNDNVANATDANHMLRLAAGAITELPVGAEAPGADVSGEEPRFIGAYDAALVLQKGEGLITAFPADKNGDGFGPDLTKKEATLADTLIKSIDSSIARTVRLSGSATLEPGALIDVPIGIDMGERILGFQFVLEYDVRLLTLDNVSKGKLTENWLAPVIHNQPGRLGVAAAGIDALSGGGSLINVRFRANSGIAPGTVASFAVADLYLNDGTIPASVSTAVVAPELTGVTPDRGADSGGTVVQLSGVNLGAVDTVYFGDIPSDSIHYDVTTGQLLAVAPAGSGNKVNITVSALGQTSTLARSFSYFRASVKVTLASGKSAETGLAYELPIVLETDGAQSMRSMTFVVNYDPRTFAALDPAKAGGVVTAAPGRSLQVQAALRRAGQLEITATGALAPGEICLVRLVPIAMGGQTQTLLYIDAVAATDGESKAMEAAGGMSIETMIAE